MSWLGADRAVVGRDPRIGEANPGALEILSGRSIRLGTALRTGLGDRGLVKTLGGARTGALSLVISPKSDRCCVGTLGLEILVKVLSGL